MHNLCEKLATGIGMVLLIGGIGSSSLNSAGPVLGSPPAAGMNKLANPARPRLAVIADRRFDLHKSPLVSLLEVKLSEEPNLVLLQRTEIDRILREQQLTHAAFHERRNVITVASCSPCFAATDEQETPAHRVAILASEEIKESGLSDLLTVRLQQLPNIGLVERDLLQRVMSEIQLSTLLGADQTENRRKVGVFLKADRLVLLALEQAAQEQRIKVIVSECSKGARLRIGWVLFDNRYPHGACRDLMKIISETLERFEGGVNQIIGVSYFLSRNLVHDYDHLQAGYANLLGNALSTLPGLAVIEIEEARAIRLEEELAGDMQTERVVPLLVEGEFKVLNPGSKTQNNVHVTVTISDNTGIIRQMERRNFPMNDVAEFITDDLAPQILRLSKNPSVKMLDKEKQFAALVDRASQFAMLGAWKHSAGLREAAVLLKPGSVQQRIRLIAEYRQIGKVLYSFEHFEYMIFNRLIHIDKALELSRELLFHILAGFYDELSQAQKSCAQDFMQTAYPEILKLQPSKPSLRHKEYQDWYEFLAKHLASCRDDGCPTIDDLKSCLDIHENLLPEEVRPSLFFTKFLKNHVEPGWSKRCSGAHDEELYFAKYPEHFSEQDFLNFITAMSRSKRPLASFYGRYALLYHEYHKRRKQGGAVDDLRQQAEVLINQMRKRGSLGAIVSETNNVLKEMDEYIQKQKGERQASYDKERTPE